MYKVIVAGSTDFTSDCILQLLKCSNVNIVSVIAPIDTKKDRKGNIIESEVSIVAKENNLNILKPENINSDDFYDTLVSLDADFFIIVAYGRILSKRTLSIPKIMPLNIHGSLLPILRGASPVEHALLYNFKETGTTLQKMDYKLDEGDIILSHSFTIDPSWQFIELYNEIKKSGVYILSEFFNNVDYYISNLKSQDHSIATFCSKIKKEDGKLDFSKSALELHNMTRAFVRWPTAYCYYNNTFIKVFISDYKVIDNNSSKDYGRIVDINNDYISIQVLDGFYMIKELQREGKKRQSVREFLTGNRLCIGEYFN